MLQSLTRKVCWVFHIDVWNDCSRMFRKLKDMVISESLRIKRTLQRGDLFLLMFSRKAFKMTICCFMIIYGQLNATPPKEIASLVIKDYKSPLSLNLGVGLRGPLDSYKNGSLPLPCFFKSSNSEQPGKEVLKHLPNSSKLQKDLVFWGGQNQDYNLLMLISPPGVLTQLVWRFVNQRMNKRKQTTIISNWWLFMIVILGGKGLNGYVAG